MVPTERSIGDIVGPWVEPTWDSGLIDRFRSAWNTPIASLTKLELATFLIQRIGVEALLPVAKERLVRRDNDDSELFVGQLAEAVSAASSTRANG